MSTPAGGGGVHYAALPDETPEVKKPVRRVSTAGFERKIDCDGSGEQRQTFVNNFVKTSRYKKWDFLPRNLFEQLTEPQNAYFLIIGFLQCLRPISTTQGVPTMYLPLSFILLVSAARAALEDYRRHVVDEREASKEYLVFDREQGTFVRRASGDIVVGDIVKMITQTAPGEAPLSVEFPADMLFVASALNKGHCFVETASLDGETNLKTKNSIGPLQEQVWTGNARSEEGKLGTLKFSIACEGPNVQLHSFRGVVNVGDGTPIALSGGNLLLRGTELRNTPYLYALVVYTGTDSKIRQNITHETRGQDGVTKKSSVMKRVDKLLLGMLSLQFCLCLIAAIGAGVWVGANGSHSWYLSLESSAWEEGALRFFTWFIILSQMVPISLLVSTEIVKTTQAKFISWDPHIYDEANKAPTVVRTSVLNEDLGQVQYVFSDKTGTLTQNKMEFRVAFVRASLFGDPESEIAKRVTARMDELKLREEGKRSNVERRPWTEHVRSLELRKHDLAKGGGLPFGAQFKRQMLEAMWGPKPGEAKDEKAPATPGGADMARMVRTYLTHMAISNTITPIPKRGDDGKEMFVFQASSPDELALCQFAQYMGFQFRSRSRDGTLMAVDKQGYGDGVNFTETYHHLATLDFNSKRKRVTLVYQLGTQVYVMCKGADSEVLPLLHVPTPEEKKLKKDLTDDLVEMAKKGLRTMIVSHGEKSVDWWTEASPSGDEAPATVWQRISILPDAGTERGHTKGECADECKVCAGLNKIEMAAEMILLGATALEDKLQDLVPECIDDFLYAGIKVWMLTGDKRETAKNIGLACNLIDPDMERVDSAGEQRKDQLNRLIHVTGHWAQQGTDIELRQLFAALDRTKDGWIDKKELCQFLRAIRVPEMDSDVKFDALYARVDRTARGKIAFAEFKAFMHSTSPTRFKAVQTDVREGLARVHQIGENVLRFLPVSMVLEGSAFEEIYPPDDKRNAPGAPSLEELTQLQNDFFALATFCKSCVCCRLTPSQKGKIVAEMRARQAVVTLAVGDGGNDCVMIKQANVGVGITGEEGTAASRAADYAIGQFRFLHGLLFVHGWWSYRRISKLVLYIFYKTSLVALSMFFFGFFSAFSGQQFFNDVSYQLYNVVFTATPVMILAVLDQGLNRETLEDNPKAYGAVLGGKMFDASLFALWIFRSLFHSFLLFFIVYFAMGVENVTGSDMKDHGLWFTSTAVYTSVVLLATLRILLDMATITRIHHLVVWGSVLAFFVILVAICANPLFNTDVYWVAMRLFSSASGWFSIVLAVSLPIMIDVAALAVSHAVKPAFTQILRERDWLKQKQEESLDVQRAREDSIEADQPALPEEFKQLQKQKSYSAKPKATTVEGKESSDAAAINDAVVEAAILHVMRFQNLSGSALEATAASGFMDHTILTRTTGGGGGDHKEAAAPYKAAGTPADSSPSPLVSGSGLGIRGHSVELSQL